MTPGWRRVMEWESQHKWLTWYVAFSVTLVLVLLIWRG